MTKEELNKVEAQLLSNRIQQEETEHEAKMEANKKFESTWLQFFEIAEVLKENFSSSASNKMRTILQKHHIENKRLNGVENAQFNTYAGVNGRVEVEFVEYDGNLVKISCASLQNDTTEIGTLSVFIPDVGNFEFQEEYAQLYGLAQTGTVGGRELNISVRALFLGLNSDQLDKMREAFPDNDPGQSNFIAG